MSRLSDLVADLRLGLAFYTRLPLGHPPLDSGALARGLWTGPIVGGLVGLLGAGAYGIGDALGLPPWLTAAFAVAAILAVTGCLHEDGLADTVDGFGGGATRERKLEIMRDSRIGTYGVCALALSLLLRVGAIASLAEPVLVLSALVAAHAASRAAIPAFMMFVPPARTDGLSAGAGRPSGSCVATAIVLGVIALGGGLGPSTGLIAFALVGLAGGAMAWLCRRQIGGQTGDVLGALQQTNEILVLATVVATVGANL
jgi:adenosylcobinamide-GDP ribazoletransferase